VLRAPELEVIVVVKLSPAPVFCHPGHDPSGKQLYLSLHHHGFSLYRSLPFPVFGRLLTLMMYVLQSGCQLLQLKERKRADLTGAHASPSTAAVGD
jgi:hypothetical protein